MRRFWRYLQPVMAVLGLLLIWWALRPRSRFVVHIEREGVEIVGDLPRLVRERMTEFFTPWQSQLAPLRIEGRRRSHGLLVLRFDRPVDAEDERLVREFLESIL